MQEAITEGREQACDHVSAPFLPGGAFGEGETVKAVLGVAALTVLGLFLRFAAINEQSFWYDEAVSASLIQSSYADLYFGKAKDNGNPPLYPLMAKAWSTVFGRSEVGMRSFSAIAGALAVAVLALVGFELLGQRTGWYAAALLAISPLAVELSNEARTYALLHLLVVASTLFFIRWAKHGRRLDLAAYTLLTFLSCFSHYYAFFVPLAHFAALVAARSEVRKIATWAGAMLVAAVLWSPWLPAFTKQLGTSGNLSRLHDRWKVQFAATPVAFGFGRTLAWRESSRPMLLFAVTGTLIAFGLPLLVAYFGLCRRPFAGVLLGAWLLLPIGIPLLVALLGTPLYSHRYASVALPAFVLVAAVGFERCRPPMRWVAAGVLLALTGVSFVRYATQPLKDDWRRAAGWIQSRIGSDEVLLFDSDIEVSTFLYYGPRHGSVPPRMIGITKPPEGENTLEGVLYQDGRRVDAKPKDYSPSLDRGSGLWLALCVPAGSEANYRRFFKQHGYTAFTRQAFHRIVVLHFSKATQPAAQYAFRHSTVD